MARNVMWIEREDGSTVAFVYWGKEKGNTMKGARIIGSLTHCEIQRILDGMTCEADRKYDDRFVENPQDAPKIDPSETAIREIIRMKKDAKP